MSTNSSTWSYDDWQLLCVSMTYVVQGVVIGGSNLFIVLVILRFKALRNAKEYVVIMGLSLADGCNMLGYALGGIRRMYLIFKDEHNSLMTPWACMTTLANLTWSFAEILSGLALLLISVDRLLCVAFPLKYIKWSTTYVLALFGIGYLYAVITGTVLSLLFVHETNDMNILVPAICYSGPLEYDGVNVYYSNYRSYAAVVFASVSIVAYGFIWFLYNKHQNQISVEGMTDNDKKHRLARQRRLTRSLGISCLCTIFVFMIPYALGYILVNIVHDGITCLLFIVSNFNPLCNVFIYYSRQPEMKEAFKALVSGKLMPDSLDQWKANCEAQQNKRGKQLRSAAPGNNNNEHH